MNDEHLMLLGSIKTHLEHIQKTTDEIKDDVKSLRKEHNDRISTLETWRNGVVLVGITVAGFFTAMGVTLQKAIAAIIHHQ